jgi:hypothetical protein
MKAVFIYWLLTADGSGTATIADMESVSACYESVGSLWVAGTRPAAGARVECRPDSDRDAIIGELVAHRCAVESKEKGGHVITLRCEGGK